MNVRTVCLIATIISFFLDGDLTLDVGPFAKAIEFAVGKPPIIIGKPSQEFFEKALKDIGINAEEAVMVGDDIVSWCPKYL